MIRRFNLYVIWEITKLFLIALIAFTTLILLAGVAQQLQSQGLGPQAILQLIPYVLPISLQYALPATILFAVSSVFGRISAENEVLAVLASGVPPLRIMTPTLIATFLLSLFAVWLNDLAMSWGRPGMNKVVMHSIEQVVYGYLSTQGSFTSNQGFSIHVHGIGEDGRELISPSITIPTGTSEAITVDAASARLTMDPYHEVLRIQFVDSHIEGGNQWTHIPGPWEQTISLSNATKKGTSIGPSEYAMREIGYQARKTDAEIEKTQEILAARTAMGLGIGKYDWLDSIETHQALGKIDGEKARAKRLRVEPWRRWAGGFSCFFFVWVAIPFSIWMRSADHWTSFGACFMPILLMYYPVFAVGLDHAKDGSWPPASVWLGNLLLFLVGCFWLRKLYRN